MGNSLSGDSTKNPCYSVQWSRGISLFTSIIPCDHATVGSPGDRCPLPVTRSKSRRDFHRWQGVSLAWEDANVSISELSLLIVEDDEVARDAIGEVLRDAGFTVDAEATAETALSKIREKKFDLVITDIHLRGGRDGLSLMHQAREFRPDLRCVFMSGQYLPIVCDPAIDEFLAKPFRANELVGCIWKVLTSNTPNPHAAVAKPGERYALTRLPRHRNGSRHLAIRRTC
jgi:CheY-like chemotaxis protein